MTFRSFLLPALCIACSTFARAEEAPSSKLVESLLTARTPESFAAAYSEAQNAQLPSQVLLEARFLYLVDQQDNAGLAALSKELVAATPHFDPSLSSIFSLKEDWLAITHYTQALDALEKKNSDAFKKHITEAFWLSPRQAAAFAPHIDRFHLDKAMAQLRLDRGLVLRSLTSDTPTPLFQPDSKATLLYFWSPWSRECVETLDSFKSLAAEAKQHNIHLVAVLAENSTEVAADAKQLILEEKLGDLSLWCTDTTTHSLSTHLRLQSIPTAVLLTNQGKILSHADPFSDELWQALQQLAPEFKKTSPLLDQE